MKLRRLTNMFIDRLIRHSSVLTSISGRRDVKRGSPRRPQRAINKELSPRQSSRMNNDKAHVGLTERSTHRLPVLRGALCGWMKRGHRLAEFTSRPPYSEHVGLKCTKLRSICNRPSSLIMLKDRRNKQS